MNFVPFNKIYSPDGTSGHLADVAAAKTFANKGEYIEKCRAWIRERMYNKDVYLTTSCTTALEASIRCLGLEKDDEIVLPSFTFVSTANAVVLAGLRPVFCEISSTDLCMDVTRIEECISEKTKAIIPVHYGGTSCDMNTIMEIALRKKLEVVEDVAHSFLGNYMGKKLGTFGRFSAFSFHETKNIQCGQGGAILYSKEDEASVSVFLEKGTDRRLFDSGKVSNYTWKNVGSNYLMSELHAAVLWSQLSCFNEIHENRKTIWQNYHKLFEEFEKDGMLKRPVIKSKQGFAYHNYFVILSERLDRQRILDGLMKYGVHAVSHYQPLHLSEAGKKYGLIKCDLSVTAFVSKQIVRLPFYFGLSEVDQLLVFEAFKKVIREY